MSASQKVVPPEPSTGTAKTREREAAPIRLLYISSMPCEPTGGGPVQMHRHFIETGDFDFHTLLEPKVTAVNYLIAGMPRWGRVIQRVSNTRFFPEIYALNCLVGLRREFKRVVELAPQYRPEAIVTVAYGGYAFLAAKVARSLKLPLVTFFHDWWPDLTPCRGIAKRVLDNAFRKLYQQSTVALCVCEQIRNELGDHLNAPILYPIPSFKRIQFSGNSPAVASRQRFRLVYLGTLQGKYGETMRELTAQLIRNPDQAFEFKLYGSTADWPEDALRAAKAAGIYQGEPDIQQAAAALTNADGFLIVMNFDEADRRRVRTSFPSKMLEYSAYGKPMVVWGPSNCSAGRFVVANNVGCLVASSAPQDLIRAVKNLAGDPTRCASFGRAAVELSKSIFDPFDIHSQLQRHIATAVGR